jgi:hypothetical protein
MPDSAANAATMAAAVATHATTLAGIFRYGRWIINGSDDTEANMQTGFASFSDNRVLVCYSTTDITSSKPIAARGTPALPMGDYIAFDASRQLISTDLARVANGSMRGVVAVGHDEYQSETLDVHRISTCRSWPGRTGYYITNARIKSAAGSDYRYWQHGRIMDVACSVVYREQQLFLSSGYRTNADGTIDERDALKLETIVTEALREVLTQPDNVEGTRGHVSDLSYRIDRTVNLVTTETLKSTVAIRPLGYVKWITTDIGFALTV